MHSNLFRVMALILALAVIAPLAGVQPAGAQGTCGAAPAPRLAAG
jgi:hypothetical protein